MREVARRVGNAKLEGEALQNLANALYFQRKMPGALQAYEDRLTIERTRDDPEGIAAALVGIATIRYTFAEYQTALTTYREALALQERLGDAGAIATTLISTGERAVPPGRFLGRDRRLSRSRDLNRKAVNTAGEADALEGLGRVFLAQGDYAAALDALAGVLAEGKARDNRTIRARRSSASATCTSGSATSTRRAPRSLESRAHFEAVKDRAYIGRDVAGARARRPRRQPVHAGRGRVPQEQRQLPGGRRRGVRRWRRRRSGVRGDRAGEVRGRDRVVPRRRLRLSRR